MTTLSSSAILPMESIHFDFEDYVYEHGIPELVDPMPYRRPKSIFQDPTENSRANSVITSAKNDPRLRTVVCRHWLRGLCMKGNACEFLHKYDLSRMPFCRHDTVEACKEHNCNLRHRKDEEDVASSNTAYGGRRVCTFFQQGFCRHGSRCRFQHILKESNDLPLVGDFELGPKMITSKKRDMGHFSTKTEPNYHTKRTKLF